MTKPAFRIILRNKRKFIVLLGIVVCLIVVSMKSMIL